MSYQNLEIWSQQGTVRLDLNQHPLSKQAEKPPVSGPGTGSRIFPMFKGESNVARILSPTMAGFLM